MSAGGIDLPRGGRFQSWRAAAPALRRPRCGLQAQARHGSSLSEALGKLLYHAATAAAPSTFCTVVVDTFSAAAMVRMLAPAAPRVRIAAVVDHARPGRWSVARECWPPPAAPRVYSALVLMAFVS
jgi:hypothetical protein